jgi:hypothetical protein
MLPFGVIQIEQYRTLQKNAAKLSLPHFPLATKQPSESKLTKLNCQIPDRLSDRFSPRDFANVSAQDTGCLTQKNEAFLAKWAPTSNRKWSTNRCYRKQTTKPCLTEARTHIRPARRLLGGPARRGGLSLNFAKIAQDFATSESQNKDESHNTELPLWKLWNLVWNPLWNPLWKKTRFLQGDRPLLPGSDQNIENDVTQRKQRAQKFLPGATTAHTRLPKFRKVAQGFDELYN